MGNSSVSFQVYDIPPSSAKGPVFSVPVVEIKPQGVYDIPPTKGVSEGGKGKPKGEKLVLVRK